MTEDKQLEQIIKERNEFERENAAFRLELGAFKNRRNWTRPYDYTGTLINEHALYIPKLDIEAMRSWHTLPGRIALVEHKKEQAESMTRLIDGVESYRNNLTNKGE